MASNMDKFCCTLWRSCVSDIQHVACTQVNESRASSLIYQAQIQAIELWSNYCPVCGLSLKEKSAGLSQGNVASVSPAQPTLTSISCKACGGTGKLKDGMNCINCFVLQSTKQERKAIQGITRANELREKLLRKQNENKTQETKNDSSAYNKPAED